MTTHMTGTREQWLTARLALLEEEKALTRQSDEIAERRKELPWVRIDKDYRFDTEDGTCRSANLFRGRSQLIIYHFMLGPDFWAGCPSCSSIADGFNGVAVHLAHHDVMLWAVSRAPLAKLLAYRRRMGWTFPWASSFGGDFNADFNVSLTERQQRDGGVDYNYRPVQPLTPGGDGGPVAQIAADGRNGRGHVDAREAGHERVRARGRRRLPHLLRPMRAGWMASGACTSGSTGRPKDARTGIWWRRRTTSTTGVEVMGCGGPATLRRERKHEQGFCEGERPRRGSFRRRRHGGPRRRGLARNSPRRPPSP